MGRSDKILLAHGGGGQLTAELIAEVILPALGGQDADALCDAATIETGGGPVVFTTDSYVVWPLEFPGGDIGELSVCGTINDLAVSGADPVALSMALVLEEGLEIDLLRRLLASAGRAAADAGVTIATGDTKVIERSGGRPGITINTAGVGTPLAGANLGFDNVAEGDAVLLTGPLGQHGLAVMARREGLNIAASLQSDCAAIHCLTAGLIESLGPKVKWMRDPTRGGLAATLAELSSATGRNIEIRESDIPIDPTALAVAEMLGLDLLTAANEGKLVAVVAAEASARACEILSGHEIARSTAVIGAVGDAADMPLVEMLTRAGGRRVVQMPYGEDLPRIC
ncbi:MAG: hydrogenase expression/formation protein HypE [Phycisphaerae bacterium]|nr:hydrogenase expression/formation protein HypE [Phycisphaerae bacterium]